MDDAAASAKQPYPYRYSSEFHEPDWRRIPGYKTVTEEEWTSALWQKRNFIKTVAQLKQVLGNFLSEKLAQDILKDQAERSISSPSDLAQNMPQQSSSGTEQGRY